MARISRALSAFAATVVIGTGTLAMTPAATAATTSNIPGVGVARHPAIRGAWEGRYTCAQGLTGLDLRISRRGVGGSCAQHSAFIHCQVILASRLGFIRCAAPTTQQPG